MKNIEKPKNNISNIPKKSETVKEELAHLDNILKSRADHSKIAEEKLGFNMEQTNVLASINHIGDIIEQYGNGKNLKEVAYETGLLV